ncbi:hypothetical protein UG55_103932 [Frankia sp. EI5c]|uniref:hypothetical protein n=1 Tax=Frankia sp. EI5c TaxID=683316 RepID=UPI0007C23F96|nr:hypothetical protein [Frankia sp. EI5c]OAA23244.1 hypothetical protein UG55_103932 [Frankia sp. EI5c]
MPQRSPTAGRRGARRIRVSAAAVAGLRWERRILVDGTGTGRLASAHQRIVREAAAAFE